MPPSITDSILDNTEPRDDRSVLRLLVGVDQQKIETNITQSERTADAGEQPTLHKKLMTNNSTPSKRRKRSTTPTKGVRFSDVQTREYERIVGDHDDLLGPPLAIGWSYNQKDSVDIERYEEQREVNRRPDWELVLTPNGRRHLLMNEFGYTAEELTAAERKIAEGRRHSENMLLSSSVSAGQKKERSCSILKRARRKIGKRLSLDRVSDISSFIAMSSPFASVYATAR